MSAVSAALLNDMEVIIVCIVMVDNVDANNQGDSLRCPPVPSVSWDLCWEKTMSSVGNFSACSVHISLADQE